jgi:hypothetical protein
MSGVFVRASILLLMAIAIATNSPAIAPQQQVQLSGVLACLPDSECDALP